MVMLWEEGFGWEREDSVHSLCGRRIQAALQKPPSHSSFRLLCQIKVDVLHPVQQPESGPQHLPLAGVEPTEVVLLCGLVSSETCNSQLTHTNCYQ